jgi:hypothetical protein
VRHIAPKNHVVADIGDHKRHLRDGDVGGASVEDQSHEMANAVDPNKQLRKTYNPVNVISARRFDEARTKGTKLLEQKPDETVTSTALVTLLAAASSAKPLK